MSCTEQDEEAMAEAGWTDEEITQLRNEVTLAREVAKRDAYDAGLTQSQQEDLMDIAEKRAREETHDRWHRKMKALLDNMVTGDAKEPVHAGHNHMSAAEKANLKKLGFDA